jgi:hypothetical protein
MNALKPYRTIINKRTLKERLGPRTQVGRRSIERTITVTGQKLHLHCSIIMLIYKKNSTLFEWNTRGQPVHRVRESIFVVSSNNGVISSSFV